MTANPSASSALSISVPVWRMPIVLENYPNPDPRVTDEEATLMDFYAPRLIMLLADSLQPLLPS